VEQNNGNLETISKSTGNVIYDANPSRVNFNADVNGVTYIGSNVNVDNIFSNGTSSVSFGDNANFSSGLETDSIEPISTGMGDGIAFNSFLDMSDPKAAIRTPSFVFGENAGKWLITDKSTNNNRFTIDGNEMRLNDSNGASAITIPSDSQPEFSYPPVFLGGTTTRRYGSNPVDLANRERTYLTLAPNGTGDDWCYLRQLSTGSDYTLSWDIHDDDENGKFLVRGIESFQSPDEPATTWVRIEKGIAVFNNRLEALNTFTNNAFTISELDGHTALSLKGPNSNSSQYEWKIETEPENTNNELRINNTTDGVVSTFDKNGTFRTAKRLDTNAGLQASPGWEKNDYGIRFIYSEGSGDYNQYITTQHSSAAEEENRMHIYQSDTTPDNTLSSGSIKSLTITPSTLTVPNNLIQNNQYNNLVSHSIIELYNDSGSLETNIVKSTGATISNLFSSKTSGRITLQIEFGETFDSVSISRLSRDVLQDYNWFITLPEGTVLDAKLANVSSWFLVSSNTLNIYIKDDFANIFPTDGSTLLVSTTVYKYAPLNSNGV
jgi:hypothetical protein